MTKPQSVASPLPSVARVLNGLSEHAAYPILLLYPPETPVPWLSCRNLLLGSLLCPWHDAYCWIQHVCKGKGIHYVKFVLVGFVLVHDHSNM